MVGILRRGLTFIPKNRCGGSELKFYILAIELGGLGARLIDTLLRIILEFSPGELSVAVFLFRVAAAYGDRQGKCDADRFHFIL